ncbi:MAG: hypothetical protein HC900_03420 [Methylacidiphilales bacterium]|nr:hypothetical protein [Candidatus Methylacidiphilales bacterium]
MEVMTAKRCTAGAIVATQDAHLAWLARQINENHREVRAHSRGMLVAAKQAGEALLEAKNNPSRTLPFKEWVAANTSVSYPTAAVYMRVAREWDARSSTLDLSHTSLRDFIDNKPRPKAKPASVPFTKEDADYAMKLHRLAEDPCNANESGVARTKLEKLAADHGMTRE